MKPSQSLHRSTFISTLTDDVNAESENTNKPFYTAATRVLLEWLGYDLDDVVFIDKRDRGVDAWFATDTGLEIFQVKTHDPTSEGNLYLGLFDHNGIDDLRRAQELLQFEKPENVLQDQLRQLLHRWNSMLRSHRLEGSEDDLLVTLHLVLLGDGLTDASLGEFENFQRSNSDAIEIDGVFVKFQVVLHTIDQIIDNKWREVNRNWRDVNNRKMESIELQPFTQGHITDNKNAIFYCHAIDLVDAYDLLGYQLFEPNVRANIKKSPVNKAIRNSAMHRRSRQDFRFLNNGVTIICDQFSKPRREDGKFKIIHPGIVNGLQTVVALHAAFNELDPDDRDDFEKNCAVLVRLLMNNAVDDIALVVKATNNQNPMKPRNLVSNSLEQLNYAKLFARENWFYEAKEGAWDAFDSDNRRWRPDLQKRSKDFRVNHSGKVRKVDNERLAQVWLSFIGFSSESVNRKKELFDDPFYSFIFKKQLPKHGMDYSSLSDAERDALEQAPDHRLMLLAFLTWEFAKGMTPSAQQNRQSTCERLGIDPKSLSKAQLDVQLAEDETYTLIQTLNGMSVLFVEFVGYVLYKALEEKLHRIGYKICSNHSFQSLATNYSVEEIKALIDSETYHARDILAILWLAFVDTIQDMLLGEWGKSYRTAQVKVRFIFSNETRNQLYRAISDKNEFMKKRTLSKTWAYGVSEGQGLFDFIWEICAT